MEIVFETWNKNEIAFPDPQVTLGRMIRQINGSYTDSKTGTRFVGIFMYQEIKEALQIE